MDIDTIDSLHLLVYRIKCGSAILVAVRDALKTAALDLDAYVLALNGTYDYLSNLTEELHTQLEAIPISDTETVDKKGD